MILGHDFPKHAVDVPRKVDDATAAYFPRVDACSPGLADWRVILLHGQTGVAWNRPQGRGGKGGGWVDIQLPGSVDELASVLQTGEKRVMGRRIRILLDAQIGIVNRAV